MARMLDSWLRLLLNQKAQVKGISFTDKGGRLVPQGVIQPTGEPIITIYYYFSNLVSSETRLLEEWTPAFGILVWTKWEYANVSECGICISSCLSDCSVYFQTTRGFCVAFLSTLGLSCMHT